MAAHTHPFRTVTMDPKKSHWKLYKHNDVTDVDSATNENKQLNLWETERPWSDSLKSKVPRKIDSNFPKQRIIHIFISYPTQVQKSNVLKLLRVNFMLSIMHSQNTLSNNTDYFSTFIIHVLGEQGNHSSNLQRQTLWDQKIQPWKSYSSISSLTSWSESFKYTKSNSFIGSSLGCHIYLMNL